jgi:hypothetical protein
VTQTHALLLTLGIEGVVGALLVRTWWNLRGATLGRAVVVILAASLLTHPFAWTANRQWLTALSFPVRATIIELSVTLAEATILALALARITGTRPPWSRCAALSLAMNAASFGYGLWRFS